jgi:hypothetical protein
MTLSKPLAGSLFALAGLGIAQAILLVLLDRQGLGGGSKPSPIVIVGGSTEIMSSDTWSCDSGTPTTCTSVHGNHSFNSYAVTTTPGWFPSSATPTSNPKATTTTEDYTTASGGTANGGVVVSIAAGGYIQAKATTGTLCASANMTLTYTDTNCDRQKDENGCRFRMNKIQVTDSSGNPLGDPGNCPTVLGIYKCEVDLNQ